MSTDLLKKVSETLNTDVDEANEDCKNWLSSSNRNPIDELKQILEGERFGYEDMRQFAGVIPRILGQEARTENGFITFNIHAPFFHPGYVILEGFGRYDGFLDLFNADLGSDLNEDSHQIAWIVHELGHVIGGLLKPDLNDPNVSKENHSIVLDKCFSGGNNERSTIRR